MSDIGDLGPEGVKFIPAMESPADKPVVAVGNELNGSTTLYRVGTLGGVGSAAETSNTD